MTNTNLLVKMFNKCLSLLYQQQQMQDLFAIIQPCTAGTTQWQMATDLDPIQANRDCSRICNRSE